MATTYASTLNVIAPTPAAFVRQFRVGRLEGAAGLGRPVRGLLYPLRWR